MASLRRFPGSKFWFACLTLPDGRRVQRSTKETDRRKAQKIADAIEGATRRQRTARQVREVIADLHRQITGEALPTVSVRAFVAGWLERKTPEVAPGTLAFYRATTGAFVDFLGEAAEQEVGAVDRATVTRFRNAVAATLAPRTVNHKLKVLRAVFQDARREQLIEGDPTEFVDVIRAAATRTERPFTLDELRALLGACDPEWRSMVLCGLYLGQRLGDVACLRWSNLDLVRNEAHLVTRKTQRRMTIPLAPPLARHLASVRPPVSTPDGPVHPRAARIVAEQGKTGSLSTMFTKVLSDAGLRPKTDHQGTGKGRDAKRGRHGLSFHSLRRTATTLLHEKGVPASVAQQLIGHDSAAIHEVYVRIGAESLRQAADALPDLIGEAL